MTALPFAIADGRNSVPATPVAGVPQPPACPGTTISLSDRHWRTSSRCPLGLA